MILCLCKGTTEEEIREIAKSGKVSYEEYIVISGVGKSCKSCEEVIENIFKVYESFNK